LGDETARSAELSDAGATLTEVLRRTGDDLSVELSRAHLDLVVSVDHQLASRDLLAPVAAWQVLTNLLLNAISVSPANGRVAVSAQSLGPERARILIEDQGPGIAPERREGLFSSGESTRAGGAGVGLRGSHALALEHGGRLELVERESEGATFAVEWPLAPTRAGRRQGIEGLRVLLLEDDAAILELLELSLRARGAEVVGVRDLRTLEGALSDAPCDVLLVDLSPLALGGHENDAGAELDRLAGIARAQRPGATVFAISGSATTFSSPHVHWVRKPFSPGELLEAIERVRG
jgi:CheY-like chemotaxis protein